MEKILFSLLIFLNIKLSYSANDDFFIQAESLGFDLTNENDQYFHDICLNLKIIEKDVTLEYRRKYYFFPKNPNKKIEFQRPLRNNTKDCFRVNVSLNNLLGTISTTLVVVFLFQCSSLIIALSNGISNIFENTPYNKFVKMNQKNKIINKNDTKNNYAKFIAEDKKEDNKEKGDNNNSDINLQENNIDGSLNPFNIKNFNNNLEEEKEKESDNNDRANSNSELNVNNEGQTQENEKQKNYTNDIYISKEKSKDNYTFGLNFGTNINFISNNQNKDEKNADILENKVDKMKRIQKIYEEINPSKKQNKFESKDDNNKIKKNKNNINDETFFSPEPPKIEKIYVREEYFYFKYLLARIEDKRTFIQIYLDLLEQNQIFVKFFSVPFNIYEDRFIQVLYYLLKIDLYFLFNSLLINNSVINDIFDDKNNIFSDIKRSLFATLYTYIICLFLYNLTNVKQVLIKRRYKLSNMKVRSMNLRTEFINLTKMIGMNFLYHKIYLFIVSGAFIIGYSFYVTYSFCKVYYYTELLLLKCVIFSVLISQLSPFLVCFIPAFLRKQALNNKSLRLYDLVKIIEKFFLP